MPWRECIFTEDGGIVYPATWDMHNLPQSVAQMWQIPAAATPHSPSRRVSVQNFNTASKSPVASLPPGPNERAATYTTPFPERSLLPLRCSSAPHLGSQGHRVPLPEDDVDPRVRAAPAVPVRREQGPSPSRSTDERPVSRPDTFHEPHASCS